MKYEDDTIAAIATPIGEGGISIVRLSGKHAFEIVDRVFRGKTALKAAHTHTAHVGYIVDLNGEPVDEAVSTVYKSPHSYTGENCVEVSCHGGVLVTRRVLESVLQAGARMAEPGEFTKQAFINGRLDLSQAEAVADLIHSRSELSRKSSLQQLAGKLSERVKKIREQLIETAGLLELELDFAEEDIELANKQEISSRMRGTIANVKMLVESFSIGRYYREGVKVVILGRPNVGKSSLLNALLNENRAIVTDIPGTTRDTIEENIIINGVLFRLVDTAGLRDSVDVIEMEGIRRTESEIAAADLILLVVDLSQASDNYGLGLIQELREKVDSFDEKCIVVLNKLDLVARSGLDTPTLARFTEQYHVVKISAVTHEGLDKLKIILGNTVLGSGLTTGDSSVVITNVRHKEALERAMLSLELASGSLDRGLSPEFVSVDVRSALDFLGEIAGIVTSEEILKSVFQRFCIGK
ncbi:MAG: tRNA uridine-5-carboxymethylaminomethyl(34) synthesis GTPase MnmE [Bacteroidota bacterium]